MHPSFIQGAAAIVPIVTDHALYAPASITMLEIMRRFVLPGLAALPVDSQNEDRIAELRHHLLQIQFVLAQIADVEQHKKSGQL